MLTQEATGFITHRDDFLNLWRAFDERGVGEDEEVIVHWIKKSRLTGRTAHVEDHARAERLDLP